MLSTESKATSGLLKLGVACQKCCERLGEWKAWLCDPEGPAFAKFVLDFFLRLLGRILGFVGVFVLIDTVTFDYSVNNLLILDESGIRYLGAISLLLGVTLYFPGRHAKRIEIKTSAYQDEIDTLVADVKKNLDKLSPEQKEVADYEIDRLLFFKNKPSEVSVSRLTTLEKIKVDTLDRESIVAHARSRLLDYKFLVESHENYVRFETIIEDLINRDEIDNIKAHLKELAQKINEERFSTGYGEAVLESLSHWSIPSVIALFLIGINPLLEGPYLESPLNFLHWAVLGITGAVLYSVNNMRKKDTTKVGEDEGNLELRTMILGIMLGAFSAILLYALLQSGAIGGNFLPQLGNPAGPSDTLIGTNVLSVFWGIAAGFSAKLAERLVGSPSGAVST